MIEVKIEGSAGAGKTRIADKIVNTLLNDTDIDDEIRVSDGETIRLIGKPERKIKDSYPAKGPR